MAGTNIKNRLLDLFRQDPGSFQSGEEMAKTLRVSRTAVWKAMNSLRAEGFQIEGTQKKGYRLLSEPDRLLPDQIAEMLTEEARAFFRIHTAEVTASTNQDVREAGLSGEPEGYVLIAESQTAGKGRQGRSFYSPAGSGLYMSILLRPTCEAKKAVMITALSAAAGAEAVELLLAKTGGSTGLPPVEIKWVNDLYFKGLKIAGILTEAIFSMENAGLDQAVLGIGFNLSDPPGGFTGPLQGIAGSIFGEQHPKGARNMLTAFFLNRFYSFYREFDSLSFLSSYRDRQLLTGLPIDVLLPDGSTRPAKALGVDEECRLLVEYPEEEGKTYALQSGEVRVRKKG